VSTLHHFVCNTQLYFSFCHFVKALTFETSSTYIRLQGAISQKTVIFIPANLKTGNIKMYLICEDTPKIISRAFSFLVDQLLLGCARPWTPFMYVPSRDERLERQVTNNFTLIIDLCKSELKAWQGTAVIEWVTRIMKHVSLLVLQTELDKKVSETPGEETAWLHWIRADSWVDHFCCCTRRSCSHSDPRQYDCNPRPNKERGCQCYNV
jgi:hypothetical protein